nr:hypothetical protein [Tanacetum cinerariifolium]
MKLSMNNCHHPRVQHPFERAHAGYVSSVCLYHRSAVLVRPNLPSSSNNKTLAHLISPVGVVKRVLFRISSGIGNSGGVPIGGVLDSGARINVDGAADLIRTIDSLVLGSIIGGGGGSGVNIGNGIRNGGNGYDVDETGDSGGVGMASNLSTSDFEGNDIGIYGRTNILAVTRYADGGGVATVSPSSKGYV